MLFAILYFKKAHMPIEIIEYSDKYAEAFRQLNLEWLDGYNLTESHDLMVLDDPRGTVRTAGVPRLPWCASALPRRASV